jgi:hypothetical protein
LVGAILLEQNDEWAVQRARCMTLETIAPLSEDLILKPPAVAAPDPGPARERDVHPRSYTTSWDTIFRSIGTIWNCFRGNRCHSEERPARRRNPDRPSARLPEIASLCSQ